jgi:hypothetical protein
MIYPIYLSYYAFSFTVDICINVFKFGLIRYSQYIKLGATSTALDDLFGLKQDDLENIIAIIQQHVEIEEAIVFGTRTKGNYKTDIDIALKGAGVNHTTTSNISYILNEETQMPSTEFLCPHHAPNHHPLRYLNFYRACSAKRSV